MAMEKDLGIDQVLAEINKHRAALVDLQDILVTHARLQAYTEYQYDELVLLAYEGIAFLNALKAGDVINQEWCEARDILLDRARKLIQNEEVSSLAHDTSL